MLTQVLATAIVRTNVGIGLLVLACLVQIGCYYDVEDELYLDTPGSSCDTTAVTFSGKTLPILRANCFNCHAANIGLGNVLLEPYAEVRRYVDDGSLLCSVQHGGGCSPMPKGAAQLSACDLSLLQTWINAGAPNN